MVKQNSAVCHQSAVPPPGALLQVTKEAGGGAGTPSRILLPDQWLSPESEGPAAALAIAGVRLGHPDVRVPAWSSASPCLLREGFAP